MFFNNQSGNTDTDHLTKILILASKAFAAGSADRQAIKNAAIMLEESINDEEKPKNLVSPK